MPMPWIRALDMPRKDNASVGITRPEGDTTVLRPRSLKSRGPHPRIRE
jgi:hypothetical protein